MQCIAKQKALHPLVSNNPTIDSHKYYCPFLERGFCRDGYQCKFSHDNTKSIKIPKNCCRFYLANKCMYGIDCKFEHTELCEPSSSTSRILQFINTCSSEFYGSSQPNIELFTCDLCDQACLDPQDLDQQRQHREDCIKDHEVDMELSFAVQRSLTKVCGICMETVVDKEPSERRFGILEKCNHTFCLSCIRKWRNAKQFDSKTIRSCPECRTSSDFIVPSKYWVEEANDKKKLIDAYKEALKSKPCKYFDQGRGECPFASFCFYKHEYPDGRVAVLGRPRKKRRAYYENQISTFSIRLNLFGLEDFYEYDLIDEEDDEFAVLNSMFGFFEDIEDYLY